MNSIIFVKLGGSLLTDKTKPNSARMSVIKQLAGELADFQQAHPDIPLVLGTGAGSFGHYAATKYDLKQLQGAGYAYGFAHIGMAAQNLNSMVVHELLNASMAATALHPSSFIATNDGEIQHVDLEPLLGHLRLGVTPVLHGDIVPDKSKQSHIISTEQLFDALVRSAIAAGHPVDKVIYATVVDGVLDQDGQSINEITPANINEIQKHFYATEGFDVTGGMAQKVQAALDLAKLGAQVAIINGQIEGNLTRALQNQALGTRIRHTGGI